MIKAPSEANPHTSLRPLNPLKSTLPSWFKLTLKSIRCRYETSAVLMGHHMIILLHDVALDEEPAHSEVFSESDPESEPAMLLAVDLRDSSIQEARVPSHLFFYHKDYTFTRYKDNQIIKFGGRENNRMIARPMVRITVTSFEPFTVKCERIKENGGREVSQENQKNLPRLHSHTAQIYKDHLYVYGGLDQPGTIGDAVDELWCFDLNNLIWEKCQVKGEGPSYRRKASSFLYKDQLYIYGGDPGVYYSSKTAVNPIMKDIFVLDFTSMSWKRLEQKEGYLIGRTSQQDTDLDGDLYKDNLLILGERRDFNAKTLCSWNIRTDSWSTFKLQKPQFQSFERASNLIVYKKLLLVPSKSNEEVALQILNLDQINFPAILESSEQSLFMNEAQSDVAFKIQDKIIPAHKQILMKRSCYFANLFDSGMMESRQDVIEINDCGFDVFKEFLRFLYFGEEEDFKLQDEDLAIKLIPLADKYLQDDLKQKCIDFLQYTLTEENVYERLDLAHKENLTTVEKWCITFLSNTMEFNKVYGLVEYLTKEENSQFAKNNLPLQKIAHDLVLDNYVTIIVEQEDKIKIYDEFLASNVKIDTFEKLAKFIYVDSLQELMRQNPNWYDYEIAKAESISLLKRSTANLRAALFDFVRENYGQLEENEHLEKLPKGFLADFKSIKELKKGVKRMEPGAQNDGEEEKPTLKKNKK